MKKSLFVIFLIYNSICLNAQLSPLEYAKKFSDLAIKNMKNSGVPASITLGQGILESASGNSFLAREGNNHFGIKCHSWTGKKIYADDDKKNECFRKYNSVYDSYADHAEFLRRGSRYTFLFELDVTDYKGWAKGLSKAGYATDPKYAEKLINLIERHELYQYDSDKYIASVNKQNKQQKVKNASLTEDAFILNPYIYNEYIINNTPYVIAKPGDNIDKLSSELNLMKWQIKKYNDLNDEQQISEGDIIYLKPKRRKAERGMETHIVIEGETMRDISQTYGVKLNRLYRMNKMEQGSEPSSGQSLNLRQTIR